MKIITFVLLLLSLTTCTKFGKNITVQGRALNPVTGEGIPNAEIILRKTTWGISGGYRRVESTFSDADGNFELNKFSFRADNVVAYPENGEDYYILGWLQDDGSYIVDRQAVKKGKKTKVEFHAVDYGEIKISVHNVNCQGPTDTLILEIDYVSFEGIKIYYPITLTGCFNNDGGFAKVPSGDYLVKWKVIRNGVENNYSHLLTVPGNGQAYYNIDY